MEFYSAMKKMKYYSQVNGWNCRTSFWVRLARLRRPKIYVLTHMWTLDLGQIQQCCWTWVTWQGESIFGRYGDR
jgi:hypothetical protein